MRVSTNNENAPAGWVGSLLPSLLLFAAAGWHSPTAASPADVASLKRMHALYKEKKECLPPATLQLMKWGRWAAVGDPERTSGRCHVFTCDGRNQNPRLEPGEGERAGSPAHLDRISAYLNETHHRISTGHYPFTSSSEAAEVVQSIREGDEHAKGAGLGAHPGVTSDSFRSALNFACSPTRHAVSPRCRLRACPPGTVCPISPLSAIMALVSREPLA